MAFGQSDVEFVNLAPGLFRPGAKLMKREGL